MQTTATQPTPSIMRFPTIRAIFDAAHRGDESDFEMKLKIFIRGVRRIDFDLIRKDRVV